MDEYYDFLNDLKDSGITNMFGTTSYLMKEFPELLETEARNILADWMKSFNKRNNGEK